MGQLWSPSCVPPPQRKKVEPPRPKPLPKPTQQQEVETAAAPVKHYYDEIDDIAPEYYRTISDFKCQAGDGLSFDTGAVIEVCVCACVRVCVRACVVCTTHSAVCSIICHHPPSPANHSELLGLVVCAVGRHRRVGPLLLPGEV